MFQLKIISKKYLKEYVKQLLIFDKSAMELNKVKNIILGPFFKY